MRTSVCVCLASHDDDDAIYRALGLLLRACMTPAVGVEEEKCHTRSSSFASLGTSWKICNKGSVHDNYTVK